MRRLGDVHDRTDTQLGAPTLRVVVVSHDLYNQGTGTVFVCPVYEGSVDADYPLFVRCRVAGVPSLIIPDQVYRMPALGLGDRPVDTLVEADTARIRASIRGIFS